MNTTGLKTHYLASHSVGAQLVNTTGLQTHYLAVSFSRGSASEHYWSKDTLLGFSFSTGSASEHYRSGRCLKLRLKEHHHALKNRDVAASAVAEHTWTTGHGMDLTKSTVLDCHPHTTTRCLLESWHIQRSTDNLNRERGTLPEVYTDWTNQVLTLTSTHST